MLYESQVEYAFGIILNPLPKPLVGKGIYSKIEVLFVNVVV